MTAHYYQVDVDWNKERRGMLCSPELNKDGMNCIEVATPPEFPKGIQGHLVTRALVYGSCK